MTKDEEIKKLDTLIKNKQLEVKALQEKEIALINKREELKKPLQETPNNRVIFNDQ